MKLKIVTMKDKQPAKPTFQLKNGGMGHNYACGVSIDGGQEEYAKVTTFTDKLVVAQGAEFETGVTAKDIKVETKEYNGNTYKEVTIYAMPSQFGGSGFQRGGGNFTPKNFLPFPDYAELVKKCWALASEIAGDKAVEAFDKILGVASVVVKLESTLDKVKETFGGEEVPF